jgi:hypothetical protein
MEDFMRVDLLKRRGGFRPVFLAASIGRKVVDLVNHQESER